MSESRRPIHKGRKEVSAEKSPDKIGSFSHGSLWMKDIKPKQVVWVSNGVRQTLKKRKERIKDESVRRRIFKWM